MTLDEQLEHEIFLTRQSLSSRCNLLAVRLLRISHTLDSDMSHGNLCINSLGEIQSEGTIIDAECGKLSEKITCWKMVKCDKKDGG